MLRTYSISHEGMRGLVWRSARLSFAVTVLLIAIFMRMPLLTGEESNLTSAWVLVYLFFVLAIGTWLTTRSTKKMWNSYRLEMWPDGLRRTQNRLPEIAISREEVIAVEEMPGRGVTIRTADSERFIFVPTAVNDYKELRSELAAWAPVNVLPLSVTWRRQWLGVTIAVLIVAWMVVTMASSSAAFVVPSSFVLSVFLLWTFISAQRSLHLARKTKIGMWLVIFPILGMTLKSIYLLANLTRRF